MKTCPRCCRAGETQEDIQGGCVDKQTIGCPNPREVIPGKDIVIQCREEACGKVVALPASSLMHRTIPHEIQCMRSPCGAIALASRPVTKETPKRGAKKEG